MLDHFSLRYKVYKEKSRRHSLRLKEALDRMDYTDFYDKTSHISHAHGCHQD